MKYKLKWSTIYHCIIYEFIHRQAPSPVDFLSQIKLGDNHRNHLNEPTELVLKAKFNRKLSLVRSRIFDAIQARINRKCGKIKSLALYFIHGSKSLFIVTKK
jgi:hypothetical protein